VSQVRLGYDGSLFSEIIPHLVPADKMKTKSLIKIIIIASIILKASISYALVMDY